MSAAVVEVQALLRFLTQDAKLPLTLAMGKMKDLQRVSLTRFIPSFILQPLNTYCTYTHHEILVPLY